MPISDMFTVIQDFMVVTLKLVYWYLEAIYRTFIPPPMKCIDGETILVTGALGGIGKELCKYIATTGNYMKLVIWDLDETDLENFSAQLRLLGSQRCLSVFPFAVDISKRENIDECCQKVKDNVGPISIIFNNAGILPLGNLLMQSSQQIDSTYQVNLMSHLWIIRQFLPKMIERNHGHIVNICSMGGLKAAQHALPYFSSKFAVNGYTEALRMELEMSQCDGIQVTTVYPYIVKTPMIRTLELKENAGHVVPTGLLDFLEPADVARKTVDGMRRGYEYIYLPSLAPILVILEYFLPMKARKAWKLGSYSDFFVYKNSEDQKALSTPFSQVAQENVERQEKEIRRNSKSA